MPNLTSSAGGAGSKYLNSVVGSFLPKYASWESYEKVVLESQRARTPSGLPKLPENDWIYNRSQTPSLQYSKDYFLKHLEKWYHGQLLEESTFYQMQYASPLSRERARGLSPTDTRKLNWKNPLFLAQFLNQLGDVLPIQHTRLTTEEYEKLTTELQYAKTMGILPAQGNPYFHFLRESTPASAFFSPSRNIYHAMQDYKKSVQIKKALKKAIRQTYGLDKRRGGRILAESEKNKSSKSSTTGEAQSEILQLLYGTSVVSNASNKK